MHEELLRQFFLGTTPGSELARDLVGAMIRSGEATRHPIVPMNAEFQVNPKHLIRVCDAVLRDEIRVESLEAIGFCLQASDHFVWDGDDPEGERVAEVTADWSAPQVNYPLTRENVERWLHFLVTGEYSL